MPLSHMGNVMFKTIKTGFLLTFLFIVFFGGCYPLCTFLIGRALFPFQSGGSLLFDPKRQTLIGSSLIAQKFSDPRYFSSRPSDLRDQKEYNATNSGGTELAPTSRVMLDQVQSCADHYRRFNDLQADVCIPIDAVTVSASNLDPHISIKNALIQALRVSKTRHMPEEEVMNLIQKFTERPFFGLIGESRVNVLLLNLALDHTTVKQEE